MAFKGLNKHIHPRNPYKTPPDIQELVKECEELGKYLLKTHSGKLSIDFKNPQALRLYTQTLLKRDFGLIIDLPDDRLIPTLTLRLNYILWIEDLLQIFFKESKQVHGIDIGSGASCIYPLLGCKMNGWKFAATEMDPKSIEYCDENIKKNSLESLITLYPIQTDEILSEVMERNPNGNFHFCMCNPPFFSSFDEFEGKHKTKKAASDLMTSASDNEIVTCGGEIEFVNKIIEDSLKLGEKIKIYTTMLGKKTSVKTIKKILRRNNLENITMTEFCQGKTMRWGIAWSFLKNVNLREASTIKEDKKPTFTLSIPNTVTPYSALGVTFQLKKLFTELKIEFEERKTKKRWFEISAKENTWIHQRRKRRQEKQRENSKEENNSNQTCKRPCEDDETSTRSKKMKITTEDTNSNALEAKLVLTNSNDVIVLEMYFVSGHLGRSGLYQLYQFLSNKLK